MSKIEKKTNTALTTQSVNSFLPTAEQVDAVVAPTSSDFFPYMEMVFPIMTDDIYEGHNWELGFRNGSEFQPIKAGTVISVIDMRNAIKRTYKSENGMKNEYAYSKIERNGKMFNHSTERFNELLGEAEDKDNRDVNLGIAMVVACIIDGNACILDFSAFKTMNGYMFNVVSPAKFNQGLGVRIDIDNHKQNCVKAKISGHMYPSRTKFTQWELIPLEKEQGQKILEALNAKSEAYMAWLNK